MKSTVATAVLASSVTATAESFPNLAGKSLQDAVADLSRSGHRSLTVSMEDQHDIGAVLKERRASKKHNGKIIRNLQNKLKRAKLRNQAQEDGDISDDDLDLGFFSRNLQNATEPESAIEELVDICSSENVVPGFSCSCSNVDADSYTASVTCAYDENCLFESMENACGEFQKLCFVETYIIDIVAPGTGSSKVCYEVASPMDFSYCYGMSYSDGEGDDSECILEVDGNQCNSCELTFINNDPNTTCNAFDCTNVDDVIATGIMCGEETIVAKKIYEYLTFGPLPCEGGCNLCPDGGKMMNLDNQVTLITGEVYGCSQLNLIAAVGFLQDVPGDLCNALPAIVNAPCECTSGPKTSTPVVDPISEEAPIVTETDKDPVEIPVEVADDVSDQDVNETVASSAACSGIDGIIFAAAVASIFLWMV